MKDVLKLDLSEIVEHISNFCSVQLLSHVWLFATPWTAARQASLSITNSRNLPKLMSIELVMPSNHLNLCCPLLLLPSIFPSIRVFSNESALCIRWSKYWNGCNLTHCVCVDRFYFFNECTVNICSSQVIYQVPRFKAELWPCPEGVYQLATQVMFSWKDTDNGRLGNFHRSKKTYTRMTSESSFT